jgi:hypothetical protein
MTRGGFEAVKFTLEELLPLTGSRTVEVTDAVLPMLCPFETEQSRLATIVMVAEAPEASELNETIRLLPEPPQTPLPVEAHDTNVSDAGRLSVTVIDEAESGPLFTRVIVYVTLLPAMIVPDEAALVTARSAAP